MWIGYSIASVLSVVAFFFAMRYNMHMFQLNGYKNREQLVWLKKNACRQWVLYAGILIGLAGIFFPVLPMIIVMELWTLLIGWVYDLMKKQPAKKKLVYTARVKRLIATDVILSIAIIILLLLLSHSFYGALLIPVSSQFFLLMAANVVNKPIEKGVNTHYINDAKKKLKENPRLTVIGVTGSYGKTSVKFYLQTLLREKYNVLVTPESYNTPMGVVKTIRESLKSTHEIFVCEMGARYVGDIKEICDIVHPQHGVITSIGPQHLETFHGIENVKNTKFELADALPAGGLLFLNGDNEYIREKEAAGSYHIRKEDPLRVVFYSASERQEPSEKSESEEIWKRDGVQNSGGEIRHNFHFGESTVQDVQNAEVRPCKETGSGYYAKEISVSRLGTDFTVVSPGGEEESYQMRLVGAHNVINVVGAIAVANTLGISLKELKVPVRKLQPVKHRLELIERGEITIIDDAYNSNPVGSKAAVETLAMFEGVRILVTPGMVELGEKQDGYNFKFGTYAAECCDYILLVGRKNTEPIREGALGKGFAEEKCRTFDQLGEALNFAYAIRDEGHKYILLENDLPDNYI